MEEPACTLPGEPVGVADSQQGEGLNFVLLVDPGPYPLASGMQLPRLQVIFGLRYGGFNPGSVLEDQASGITYTVRQQGSHLVLDPPAPRLLRVRGK